jgi:hypothetical protein
MKRAPLMRFFKASEAVQSEEDRARDARLTAIASRYRRREPADQGPEASEPLEIRNMLQ